MHNENTPLFNSFYMNQKIFGLAQIFRIGLNFSSAQIFVGPTFFVGPNFRHSPKFSSLRADIVWADTGIIKKRYQFIIKEANMYSLKQADIII